MRDGNLGPILARTLSVGAVVGLLALSIGACSYGSMTESIGIEEQRDYSGIATPGSGIPKHPNLHERSTWGMNQSYAALGFENASGEVQALFYFQDPTVVPPPSIEDQTPLQFFATPHTDEEGVGPLYNQRACIGCHMSSVDNRTNLAQSPSDASLAGVNLTATPVSRAGRQGPTDYASITKLSGNPPTAAFTLYGDYNPSSGVFNPLSVFGGPLQHDNATGECAINTLPPVSIDPNLAGGIDPITGLSPLGQRRETGQRAAPPYVGRGLMESIYFCDILANEDPADQIDTYSSLPPQPSDHICPNDCISGRHNESAASASFIGGDPLIRVGRFGLRGAGTTLLQFIVGGTQGEIGLTSPFAPFKQPNVNTLDPTACNAGGPTPNLTAARVLSVRDLIRNIAPPMPSDALFADPTTSIEAADVQTGAALFGLDLVAFRARMTSDNVDPAAFSDEANHALANDRMLGCSTCHIPIFRTGVSPAQIGGAENLSNRWAPLFSDLLIHQNPEVPYYFDEQWRNVSPKMIDPASCKPTCDPTKLVPAPYPFRGTVSRDLADYAVVPNVTGLANGNEFRTPPLMGLGKVGPPFGHDARIYLNVVGDGNYPGQPPNTPAQMQFTSFDGGTVLEDITTMDLAVLGMIELHDLPAPPINPATQEPDYALCPIVPPALDVCSRGSPWRGEARNVIEKFHLLTRDEQMLVVKFLETL
jgi:CxxC motif-containing protein (DUF1111 family)